MGKELSLRERRLAVAGYDTPVYQLFEASVYTGVILYLAWHLTIARADDCLVFEFLD